MEYENEDKNMFKEYCRGYKYFPMIMPSQPRVVVFGDIHGDYKLAINMLKMAHLINNNNDWIGGKTYLVQVGDLLDNCRPQNTVELKSRCESIEFSDPEPQDIKVFNLFTKLYNQAIEAGGAVILLLGNHELMNVMGNFNYVSKNDIDKFNNYDDYKHFKTGEEARKNAFQPGNEYSKILACTRLPAVIIGNFLFVHAGIVSKFTNKLNITNRQDIYKINYHIKKWLLGLINKNNIVSIINSSNYSLFWDRILGGIPPNLHHKDKQCVDNLDNVLKLFHVGNMVIGHTPQVFNNSTGINSTCGNKLWRVDFAGSFSFNNFENNINDHNSRVPQFLEILNDQEIKIVK